MRGRALWLAPAGAILLVGLLLSRHTSEPPASPPAQPPTATVSSSDTISWQDITGMGLPISSLDGPHCLSRTRAACFGHTPDGAALAGVHILVRTFAFVGPRTFTPTIARQVVGDRSDLQRVTAAAYEQAIQGSSVPDGEPLRADDGWLVGFHLDTYTVVMATVEILFRQDDSDGQTFTMFPVHLEWRDDDWVLVAPAWGDWRGAATAVLDPDPAYYRSYDTLGRSR